MAVKKQKPKAAKPAKKPMAKTAPKPKAVKKAPPPAAKKPFGKPFVAAAKVPTNREQAMRSAAKVAEALATEVKAPLTAEAPKRDLTPIDPKDAARAIK